MDAPVLGVAEDTYTGPNKWQVSMSWRHQRSDRHFVGSEEQTERKEEGSEVINHINIMDLGIRYNASPQWSFSIGIPYFRAARSSGMESSIFTSAFSCTSIFSA